MKIVFKGWLYRLLKDKFSPKTTKELEEELKILEEKKQQIDHRKETIRKINELKQGEKQALRKWSWDWKAFDKQMGKIGKFADGLGQGLDQVMLGKEKVKEGENN